MATNGKQTTNGNGNGPNWRAIEHAYVTDPTGPSYAQLACRFHVPADTIEKRGQRGHWSRKRSDFRQGVSEAAQKKSADRQAESLADQNLAFAAKWRELAEHHIANALKAEKGWEAQSWTVAAATAFDKWRLGTDQTTGKTEQKHSGGMDVRFSHLSMRDLTEVVDGSDGGAANAEGSTGGG